MRAFFLPLILYFVNFNYLKNFKILVMTIVHNYNTIKKNINSLSSNVVLIVVTKNQNIQTIQTLIDLGQIHFGENKVQEAEQKWKELRVKFPEIRLHMIGTMQSNKVKNAVRIFDYIHSINSKKLIHFFEEEEKQQKKKLKYFVQVNVENEPQKSGVSIQDLENVINTFNINKKLNLIGLMNIPSLKGDKDYIYKYVSTLAVKYNLMNTSMGMSDDYMIAIKNGATYVRVGSSIFKNIN